MWCAKFTTKLKYLFIFSSTWVNAIAVEDENVNKKKKEEKCTIHYLREREGNKLYDLMH